MIVADLYLRVTNVSSSFVPVVGEFKWGQLQVATTIFLAGSACCLGGCRRRRGSLGRLSGGALLGGSLHWSRLASGVLGLLDPVCGWYSVVTFADAGHGCGLWDPFLRVWTLQW